MYKSSFFIIKNAFWLLGCVIFFLENVALNKKFVLFGGKSCTLDLDLIHSSIGWQWLCARAQLRSISAGCSNVVRLSLHISWQAQATSQKSCIGQCKISNLAWSHNWLQHPQIPAIQKINQQKRSFLMVFPYLFAAWKMLQNDAIFDIRNAYLDLIHVIKDV